MRSDKEKAFELRRNGSTYKEIGEILKISKSTLSGWFKGNSEFEVILEDNRKKSKLINYLKIRELNKTRREKSFRNYAEAREKATLEFQEFQKDPLFLVALALYWGEGDKRSKYNIRISNVEPRLIKIFVLFIQKFLGVNRTKIKVGLLLYPDLNDNICRRYWAESLNLENSNFYKTIVIKGRNSKNKLSYGVCSLGFSSAYLKQKMIAWLELLSQKFNQAGMV